MDCAKQRGGQQVIIDDLYKNRTERVYEEDPPAIRAGRQGLKVANDSEAKLRIRKLTPRECFRLMGVKDEDFEKLSGLSNSTLYHLAGDSIVTTVLMAIFGELLEIEWKEKVENLHECARRTSGKDK